MIVVVRERNSMNTNTTNNSATNEVCPDCEELITADNPLVDETRYSTAFGSCIGCCDPTPYYPDLG